MSAERLRVLELIKDGKVTPEEGLELLSALQNIEDDDVGERDLNLQIKGFPEEDDSGNIENAKYLRIKVQRGTGKKNVNLVIPASIVRFIGGLGSLTTKVDDEEIDISEWWEKQDSGYRGVVLETRTKSGKDIKVELI